MTFAEMIAVATKVKDLFRFLESGNLVTLFADVELKAAGEALQRIPTAANKAAQARTCIGHLNSCYHGYSTALSQMSTFDKVAWTRGAQYEAAKTKAVFVLCVRAICHRYVGEPFNCSADLKLAQAARQLDIYEPGYTALWSLTPFGAIDMVYYVSRIKEFDVRDYELSDHAFATFVALFDEHHS